MDFTFLRATGEVAFFRSDAEQAEWTQDEMSLLCTFPFLADKNIARGMTVLFADPATGEWQAYYVRNCAVYGGEAYQQITCESLAITELSACHIPDEIEMSDITPAAALGQVLTGTGWAVGSVGATKASFGDISRGSVWQAVGTIQSNWNVHIIPRVTVNARGITGRYLDIIPPEGVFRGLRISIDKNTADPCVTYDDTELCTALYGYGGYYSEGEGDEQVTKETNFADIVWQKTANHPAKPAGQKYIEMPDMTAIYGLNGRPRFGYYQNGDIKDASILLQKTYESLQTCCTPKVSFTGTVTDLKRHGYADQPLRLYDMAIVELSPFGILLYKQIIKLNVNLLDPSGNTPTIGDYIPNIIYINRETEDYATGGGKPTKGKTTHLRDKQGEFETNIIRNGRNIYLNAKQIDHDKNVIMAAGMDIDPISGVIIYAESVPNGIGSKFKVVDNKITTEVTERKEGQSELSSRITETANAITLEVSERKSADSGLSGRIDITAEAITQEVTNRQNADTTLSSRITETANDISLEVERASAAEGTLSGRIDVTADAISQEVTNRMNGDSTLSGRITTNANKVAIVVEEKNGQNVVKTASIVTAINNSESSIRLDADKVYIGSKKSQTYIDGEIDGVNAKFNSITVVEGSATYVSSGKVYATTSLHIGTGTAGGSGALYYRGTEYKETHVVLKDSSDTTIADGVCLGTGGTTTPINLSHYHEITIEEGTGDLAGKMVVTLGAASSSEGSANFNIADTAAYINGVRSAKNSVAINDFTSMDLRPYQGQLQEFNTFTYTTDAPTPASKADTWYLADGNWSSNKKVVALRYGSSTGTAYAELEVDASSLVTSAKNAVKVSGPTWTTTPASGITGNSNTATFTTDAPSPSSGTPIALALYLVRGDGWSSGTRYVYLTHTDTTDAKRCARIDVSMPSASSMSFGTQKTSSNATQYSYDKAVSIVKNYDYTWLPIILGDKTYTLRIHPMS